MIGLFEMTNIEFDSVGAISFNVEQQVELFCLWFRSHSRSIEQRLPSCNEYNEYGFKKIFATESTYMEGKSSHYAKNRRCGL